MAEKKGVTIRLDENNRPIVRSRCFELMLYPENNEIDGVVKKCISKGWSYIFATHNLDKLENGELAKEHVHFIIKSKNAIWSTSLSKFLGIKSTYIQSVNKESEMLGYLFHISEPDKVQYDTSCLRGSDDLMERVFDMYQKESFSSNENEVVQYIMDYIVNEYVYQIGTKTDKYYCMLSYFVENGWYSVFKKNFFILKELIFRVDNDRTKL